ncbi:hypothetical protein HZI73_15085 [Vallitalea pronyensis]|uniref:Uncharacterized protein n=1 Tax=Vallitalea pronyensis TaxID=1348613 RepID=A0A8J8ML61_9FIRM|nr:hypothetical protein [Vallitalea pronyensis]QUI23526.1 hypothetical protein HZI73_15085 [Vallitalea pronyensis]
MRRRYQARNRNKLAILSICILLVTGIVVSQLLIQNMKVDKVEDKQDGNQIEHTTQDDVVPEDPVVADNLVNKVNNQGEKENTTQEKEQHIDDSKETNQPEITDIEPIASSKNNEDVVSADTMDEPKIMSSTRVEYQNYYMEDDKLEIEKDTEPPYYMLNLTREQVEEFYPEFQLMAFSPEKVVLRRVIDGHSSKYYIIQTHNKRVGVFHDYRDDGADIELEDYLKDTVDIPISGLVWEEQDKLKEGIVVYGEEELTDMLKKLHNLYELNESGEYILREYKGMMGIFYDFKKDQAYREDLKQEQLNDLLERYLRKVIDAPMTGLDEAVMQKLQDGIKVNGELELIQLLENYTS